MTANLRVTLLGDGSSDRCLLMHILWVLGMHVATETVIEHSFLSATNDRYGRGLRNRVHAALQEAPCDILFVHRDSERQSPDIRMAEVRTAARNIGRMCVPVVPVRMTEAWLLFDPTAIRLAADNPNGQRRLNLPRVRDLDRLTDPKRQLSECLCAASEKSGRRLDQFKRDMATRVHRVAEVIGDFSPLRALPAFSRFENDTIEALTSWTATFQ